MDLRNHTALVTGGAVRLGKVLALALAGSGVNVAIHYYRSDVEANETLTKIANLGVRAAAFQADLSQRDAPEAMISAAQSALGPIDILINNAAIFPSGGWKDTTVSTWDETFAVNLRAPFFLAQAFAQSLGDAHGHIINIADWRAMRPGIGHLAYTYAKAGLVAVTCSLARALAPSIQVNAIAPGAVLPPPGADEDYLDTVALQIPLKRHGTPQDIAEAMLYLLRSEFVTGELLYVTGGQEL